MLNGSLYWTSNGPARVTKMVSGPGLLARGICQNREFAPFPKNFGVTKVPYIMFRQLLGVYELLQRHCCDLEVLCPCIFWYFFGTKTMCACQRVSFLTFDINYYVVSSPALTFSLIDRGHVLGYSGGKLWCQSLVSCNSSLKFPSLKKWMQSAPQSVGVFCCCDSWVCPNN